MWGYNLYQDTQNLSKPQFMDILEFADHPDDGQKSWKPFLSTLIAPKIPKRYHVGLQ